MTTAATLANPFRTQRFAAAQATASAQSTSDSAAKLAATAESFAAALTRIKAATAQSSQSAQSTQSSAPTTHSDVLSQSRSLLEMIQQAQSGTQVGTVTGNTGNTGADTKTTVDTTGFVFPKLPQPTAAAIQTGNLPWLKAPTYLVAASALTDGRQAVAEKPSVKEFMDKTGVDFETAGNVLSGVIGSNLDLRDWGAIMASADPLSSARASAAAQYNTAATRATSAIATESSDTNGVIARSGNFAVVKDSGDENSGSLFLVDQQGNLLRHLPDDPATILAAARDFGFDVRDLAGIAEQLDAGGYAQPANIDYAGLSNGELGTQNDWRKDAQVDKKGDYGQETLAANRAVATEYGYA